MAEVRKPSLPEIVYTNKNCGNEQHECLSPLCIIKNKENKLILKFTDGNHQVFYTATRKPNNSINSSLIIYGGINGNGAIPISYSLDRSNTEQYKLYSHKSVIEEANKLLNQNGVNVSLAEEVLLEKLIQNIKNNEVELTQSDLAKSIFYHVAIVKTVNRAIENNRTDCNCSPVPLYFVDKSPFLCQQDLFYDINTLLEKFESDSSGINQQYDSTTIHQLKSYLELKSTNTSSISFEDIYIDLSNGVPTNEFINVIDEHIETAWCLLGSDLGCCGNYSGCCWFASIHCLAHDIACLNCEPSWYCFDGCVPL